MIIGENNNRSYPTVHIPQWDQINDPTVTISSSFSSFNGVKDYPHSPSSPFSSFNGVNDYPHSPSSPFSSFNGVNDYPHSPSLYLDSFASLYRYLPSNELTNDSDSSSGDESDSFASDEFRMYEFKIRRCSRGRSHDWTECPYAHAGEKARRRDPRKFHYSGNACPEFRKGNCRRGDSCEFAHGVFECWLHPSRYRTQPCKDGTCCRRKICFFAHTTEQLRRSLDPDLGGFATSPTSILVSPPFSPPLSPTTGELIASMRKMQLNGGGGGCSWSSPMRSGVRLPFSSSLRPIQAPTWPIWENEREEAPAMEFVESGRELREKMYAKLSRENSLG